MSESHEESRAREHLAELRKAARGLGQDFAIQIKHVERKIERLPGATAKETKYILGEIQDDMSNINRSIQTEARRIPGAVKGGLTTAGSAISTGATRAAEVTRDAAVTAAKGAKSGTKNAFARAAGVKRTPMKVWSHPSDSSSSGE